MEKILKDVLEEFLDSPKFDFLIKHRDDKIRAEELKHMQDDLVSNVEDYKKFDDLFATVKNIDDLTSIIRVIAAKYLSFADRAELNMLMMEDVKRSQDDLFEAFENEFKNAPKKDTEVPPSVKLLKQLFN